MSTYPEHEKLAKISSLSNQLGEFIDWMQGRGYLFAEWSKDSDDGDVLYPVHKTINQWLAAFYEIDLEKIEDEKQAMFDEIRAANVAREQAQT